MGRPNSVLAHPELTRINSMLDAGLTYDKIIRTVGSLSLSALSRHAISRKTELARLVDDEPGVTNILVRLTEVADHAQKLRRESKFTGTPVHQARAIKAELDALGKLADKLGIDDLVTESVAEEFKAFTMALKIFNRTYPESAADLIAVLKKEDSTRQLALAMERQRQELEND